MMRRNLIIVHALKLMEKDLRWKLKSLPRGSELRSYFKDEISITQNILEQYKNRI